MRHYEVCRHIPAPPEAVWRNLTDARRLVVAGTGITRIEGSISPGAQFTLWSEAVPGRAMRTRVALMSAPTRMVWVGGLPAGLFRGVRTFTLTPVDGGTELRMREEFSGPLLPLVWRGMPDLQPSFEQFVDGLARACTVSP